VYAGAAREAVFSVPAVITRIQADFVPLALRATTVNGVDSVRDDDNERWLYQRINRAKIAPQGICVLDSRGRVLVWTQMFDDDQGVLAFLDHSLKRFREETDAGPPVVTERYLRFPGERSGDSRDPTKLPVIAVAHAAGNRCLARSSKEEAPPGSMAARLVGRALDAKGEPLADTVKQEHYAEDRFSVPPALQAAVAKVLRDAGPERVRLPNAFARVCASHAHLGHIDVQPLLFMSPVQRNKGEWKRCELWARPATGTARRPPGDGPSLWRIEGDSEVVSELAINGNGVHDVKLTWEGFIEMDGEGLTRLVLSARGSEKLQFAKDDHPLKREKRDEVAFLPGGRPIDLAGGVRYGIIGEGATADEE
jgi:hypothetical protein